VIYIYINQNLTIDKTTGKILKKMFFSKLKNWAFKPNINTQPVQDFKQNVMQIKYITQPKQLKTECNANKIDIDFHVKKINK